MPRINKREQILAGVVGVIIALFLMERLVGSPFFIKLENIDIQIKAQEEKFERTLYMNLQKNNITKSYEAIQPFIETGETGEGMFSVIMKQIEEIAKETGVIMQNMKPENVELKGKEEYNVRNVALTLEGYQHSIILFLYKLENGDYPLRIDKIDFKVKDRDKNLITTTIDVHLIYFV
ncbi:MAG: hypothetical protein ABH844_03825 [Candidatus Omnitrophota bacterium]